MRLAPECPHCPGTLDGAACPTHGEVRVLWRCAEPGYDAFAEHLVLAGELPTWLPWPLSPVWQVTDFGVVGGEGQESRATFATCMGPSELDGVVELTVLTEEPGTGLGARVAGAVHSDPGPDLLQRPSDLRLRLDGGTVPMWALSTSDGDTDFDRSVFVGEARGRWVWVVVRPASAALLVQDLPDLQDVSTLGPELVAIPFGSVPRTW